MHGLASSAVGVVNPHVTVTLRRYTGVVTDASGKSTPTYTDMSGPGQIQPSSADDLRLIEALNVRGVTRAVYLYDNWYGVIRHDQTGGDLLEFDARTWKIIATPEQWPDWCRVIVCLQ